MLTYRQFLNESSDVSYKHTVEAKGQVRNAGPTWTEFNPGDVYYTDGDGKFHRSDGPSIIWRNGDTEWYCHGTHHRIGGPAVEDHLGEEWYFEGNRHRLDGPAVTLLQNDGTIARIWYYWGKNVSKAFTVIPKMQKAMLEDDINNVKKLKNLDKDLQEYVLKRRPDLVSEIDGLDPEIARKYSHEVGMGGVDL